MDVSQLRAAVRRTWWLPLVGLLVGGVVALLVTSVQRNVYESTTTFLVEGAREDVSPLQAVQLAERRAPSYVRLIESPDFAERVVEALELDVSPTELRQSIDASTTDDTVLIDVTVTDASPARAQLIAQSVGEQLPPFLAELEGRGEVGASLQVTVTERPDRADSPTSPDPLRNVAVGLVAGLLVGLALAFTRAVAERPVTTDNDVVEALGAPVLAHIPPRRGEGSTLLARGATGRTAEAFRRLRNNLLRSSPGDAPKVVMVTGAVPDDGTPDVVVNLGLTLADTGDRVVLVVADLRSPWLVDPLASPGDQGLTDVLAGRAEVQEVLRRYEDRNLWVLPPGPLPADPGDVIASRPVREFVDKLRSDFDHVLVLVPDVLSVSDATGLAGHVDGVLLVLGRDRTRAEDVRQAGKVLALSRANLLGAVLTGLPHTAANRGGPAEVVPSS